MKLRILIVLFLFSSLKMTAQSIFKVVESNRNCINGNGLVDKSGHKYYRIKFLNDSTSISYPINSPNEEFDTLKAIKELLLLEGDIRLCSFPITNYNPLRSQIYMGACKDYSIQVEALFIINQLVLKKPFNYSSYPILVDRTTKKESSISGSIIKRAFKAYKTWYRKVKKIGVSGIEGDESTPLNGSPIKWY